MRGYAPAIKLLDRCEVPRQRAQWSKKRSSARGLCSHDYVWISARLSSVTYRATAYHELIHWTGGPARLGRYDLSDIDPYEVYLEEAVACIGAECLAVFLGDTSLRMMKECRPCHTLRPTILYCWDLWAPRVRAALQWICQRIGIDYHDCVEAGLLWYGHTTNEHAGYLSPAERFKISVLGKPVSGRRPADSRLVHSRAPVSVAV